MAQPRVLIVEDDPLVRMMSVEALAETGFAVIEAETIDAALAILETRADEVAVIFSDIDTPGVHDGIDLARTVRGAWPHLRVVLTSGSRLPPADELARVLFIGKPYRYFEVADRLYRLTTAPSGEP